MLFRQETPCTDEISAAHRWMAEQRDEREPSQTEQGGSMIDGCFLRNGVYVCALPVLADTDPPSDDDGFDPNESTCDCEICRRDDDRFSTRMMERERIASAVQEKHVETSHDEQEESQVSPGDDLPKYAPMRLSCRDLDRFSKRDIRRAFVHGQRNWKAFRKGARVTRP